MKKRVYYYHAAPLAVPLHLPQISLDLDTIKPIFHEEDGDESTLALFGHFCRGGWRVAGFKVKFWTVRFLVRSVASNPWISESWIRTPNPRIP